MGLKEICEGRAKIYRGLARKKSAYKAAMMILYDEYGQGSPVIDSVGLHVVPYSVGSKAGDVVIDGDGIINGIVREGTYHPIDRSQVGIYLKDASMYGSWSRSRFKRWFFSREIRNGLIEALADADGAIMDPGVVFEPTVRNISEALLGLAEAYTERR